jgi:hypothetical protein
MRPFLFHFIDTQHFFDILRYTELRNLSTEIIFMNIFKALICLDYYNLRLQHRTREIGSGGVHKIGIAWICNTLTLIGGYFIYFKLHNQSDVVYDTLSELHYYVIAGRAIMIVLLSIVYLLAFTIYGDKLSIQTTLKTFVGLDPEQQERIAKNANLYFRTSLILFLVITCITVYLFKIQ